VLGSIRRHVESDTEREVGGFLVGTLNGSAEVTEHIPALAAVGSKAALTFTHEAWLDAVNRVDTDFEDRQIVGWYHSHPGHGVFLSEYDQFIQKNFFGADGMVAYVVDPLTGEEGWFESREGDVVETSRSAGTREPSRDPAPTSSRTSSGRRLTGILTLAAVAVGGCALGYVLGWNGDEPPARADDRDQAADAAVLRDRVAELEEERAAAPAPPPAPPPPVVTWHVRRGDTLWGIAESIYGDGFAYPRIVAANPAAAAGLTVGQQLRLDTAVAPAGR
jgi:proteasome lid subunit RPN8/RPN11